MCGRSQVDTKTRVNGKDTRYFPENSVFRICNYFINNYSARSSLDWIEIDS
jgi:hypothetical protein